MSDDKTRQFSPFDDDDDDDDRTRVQPAAADDETVVAPDNQPDATNVMPKRDWAGDDAAWAGRAQVRAPRPSREEWTTADDWVATDPPEPRGKWWMPIVVGIVGLVLLGALGWGVYLIVSSDDGGDVRTPPASLPAPTLATPTTTAATTRPTETTPPPTTEPTLTTPAEATVPALIGLSQADAEEALERSGLRARTIQRPSDDPSGTVIDSDPAAGLQVPVNTTVTLVISVPRASPAATATS